MEDTGEYTSLLRHIYTLHVQKFALLFMECVARSASGHDSKPLY